MSASTDRRGRKPVYPVIFNGARMIADHVCYSNERSNRPMPLKLKTISIFSFIFLELTHRILVFNNNAFYTFHSAGKEISCGIKSTTQFSPTDNFFLIFCFVARTTSPPQLLASVLVNLQLYG